MTQSTTETITFYLEKILNEVHPLMAEGIYLAAVPHWYNQTLFAAMRDRDDGRNQGLVERLTRYSFITRLSTDEDGELTYAVRPAERMLIQRHWIIKDPQAYRAAHRRALAYWETHPDPNPFAQAQNLLYHQLFVNQDAATDYLVDRFRAYHNERQLAATERLLDTVGEARFYLALLDDAPLAELDDLLIHLRARLAQMRGRWAKSLASLQTLRQKESLAPGLRPYVTRAYGYALAHTGDYVGAMAAYETAMAAFKAQATAATEAPGAALADAATLEAEQAQTMIALGDAHVGLATSARGPVSRRPARSGRLRLLRDTLSFILSLPLIFYLSLYLGWRVWHPRFWPTVHDLDWIIARLFAVGARYYRRADPILEKYGDPGEGVAADEKLAYLYLAMGDAGQAQSQFDRILQAEEAPLGAYRQAAVRAGLGQAWLQQGQPAAARECLERALPALSQYEDFSLEAAARAALAEIIYAAGGESEDATDKVAAIAQFDRAARLRHSQEDWVGATDAVERMEALVAADESARSESSPSGREGGLNSQISEAATAVSRKLTQRQYAARFRHPLLVYFRRFTLLLLPLVILLMPMLVIQLDTSSTLTPIIQFKAAPIFDPSQVVSSQLSQGVTTANVAATTDANVIVWLAVALLAGYVLLSLLFGLLLIVFTPLRTVQERGRAATVRLDEEGIRVGESRALWAEVTEMVKGDMRLWQRPLPDESAFALVTDQERLIIPGAVNWYTALSRRVAQSLPDSARVADLDYAVLQSKLGRLYVINVVIIGILALLAWLAPATLWREIPGLPYRLADLYPFFYLGLTGLPAWWMVVRPLQTRLRLKPTSRLPWWMLGAGLALALFQAATLFRPLLTSANLYPPLVTLIAMAGAGWMIWRARERGRFVYSTRVRGGTAVLAAAVSLLMALLLWREIGAYQFLVLGNARRDRAQQVEDMAEQEALLAGAVDAYSQAIKIGATRILGIDVRAATRIPLGIPEPHSFTWLSALTNRAALQVQLGRYNKAMGSYNVILDYTDRPADVYTWRAIARQSWSTTDTGEGELATVENQYELALDDFDRAIKLKPNRARYYLWRGVTYHALNDLERAWEEYETALALSVPAGMPLTDAQRERALTGQGWIKYHQKRYADAQALFELATQANPSQAEAWTGLGYAAFSQALFADAGNAWDQAFALDPDDPAVLVSLGTLHWKLGSLAEGESASCAEYERSTDFFTQAIETPGQDPKTVAFTYRTRGQLQYLLRNCPNRSFTEEVSAAIASYDQALALDPTVTAYWQMKGRLGYVLWLGGLVEDETAVLFEALTAINEAYRRDPDDQITINFRNALLDGLEPLVPAYVAAAMAAGEYETLLAEMTLLAEIQPDNPAFALQAGLAALATGDEAQAQTWYDAGIAAAETAENGVALLTQALADLDALLSAEPDINREPFRSQLAGTLERLQAQDPATIFADGLAALQAEQVSEGVTLYRRGLAFAAQKGYLSAVATAVLELHTLPDDRTARIYPLFWQAFPQLEKAGEGDERVETAVTLGFIAAALDQYDKAAVWYNEAIRRTYLDNAQYPQLRQSRDDLRHLWAAAGVYSDAILQAIETQLPVQLSKNDGLVDEGYYWRYRTWFKYGLGMSAFRLGDEAAAAATLKSAQEDADRAYELDPNRQAYAKTYLEEAAWGWYHIERGNDAYDAGEYEAALADYEAAAALIQPVANSDARAETTMAAFKAGLASVQLADFVQAADWYEEGVKRAALHEVPAQITIARDELLEAQTERPELADEIEALLGLLSTPEN